MSRGEEGRKGGKRHDGESRGRTSTSPESRWKEKIYRVRKFKGKKVE